MQHFDSLLQQDFEFNKLIIKRAKKYLIAETEIHKRRINDSKKSTKTFAEQQQLEKMEAFPNEGKIMQVLKKSFEENKNVQREVMENNQRKIDELLDEHKKVTRLEGEMQEQFETIRQQIDEVRPNLPQEYNVRQQQGLSPARIQKFQQFAADDSITGDRCSVCQDDIEVGRRMMRLDCDGQHTFHQECVEGWFDEHKTCPNCRHVFH